MNKAAGIALLALVAGADYAAAVIPVSAEFGLDNLIHAYAPAASAQSVPAIAWGRTNGLAIWEDLRRGSYGGNEALFATRLGPMGQVLDPTGIAIGPAATRLFDPAVAWLGTNFLAAWRDTRPGTHSEIYAAFIPPGGAMAGSGFRMTSTTNTGSQWLPAIASDGTNLALVTWTDYRNGSYDIYGRLLAADGQVLGTTDIAICSAVKVQDYVAAAWGGTNFLVAWEDHQNEGAWFEGNIRVARVSPAGQVLDPNGVPVFPSAGQYGYQGSPSVAWGGTGDFLVVWYDNRNAATNQQDIFGRRVSGAGQLLDTGAFLIGGATNTQNSAHVAWGGTNYLVTWADYRRTNSQPLIYGARIGTSSNVLDASALAISSNGTHGRYGPAAAWSGTNFIALWEDHRTSYEEADIYGTAISAAGQTLHPTGLLLSTSADNQWTPAAAWGATNYLVVWRDNLNDSTSDLIGARVGTTGVLLDPTGFTICSASNKQRHPKVAWGGTNFLVVWEDDRNTNQLVMGVLAYQDIFGARVTSGGQVLDVNGIGICTNPGPQFEPVCAWDGASSFLVAWRDYRVATPPYPSDIYGTRLSSSGAVLDPAGLAICTAANFQFVPQVAWGGTNFLVTWEDSRAGSTNYDIYAARVSRTGSVLDPAGIAVCNHPTNQGSPRLAWGGTNWLVAWEDRRDSSEQNNLYGARVTPGGLVLDPAGLAVCTATAHQYAAALGWSGTNWLAVWSDWRRDYRDLVFGTRIGPAGNALDGASAGLELFADQAARTWPALAPRSNGVFLMACTGFRGDGLNAQRIKASFVDLSPPALRVLSPHGQGNPPIGTNFLVRGLPVECAVTASPFTSGTTQHVCRGWSGSGSVPVSGIATNTGTFVLEVDSAVTWHWTTNYLLAVATSGVGTVSGTNGWIAFGSNAVLTATPGAHFYRGGWSGQVPPADTNNSPLTLVMTQPRAVTINFTPYLTTNFIPHWWLAEHGLATNAAATYLDPDTDDLFTWEEFIADSDPTNRASRFATFAGSSCDQILTLILSHTRTDRVYDVVWRTNLTPNVGAWTAAGLHQRGTGGELVLTLTNVHAGAFHRIAVKRE
jgi:hypothetical protein